MKHEAVATMYHESLVYYECYLPRHRLQREAPIMSRFPSAQLLKLRGNRLPYQTPTQDSSVAHAGKDMIR